MTPSSLFSRNKELCCLVLGVYSFLGVFFCVYAREEINIVPRRVRSEKEKIGSVPITFIIYAVADIT